MHIFMPDWMSQERKDLIYSLGARIRLVSREEGGFLTSIRLSEEFAAATPGCFLPRQFSNEDNVDAHAETTGPEIWHQLQSLKLQPGAFVAGVGTGGTIMGVGRHLRKVCSAVRLHPLEPSNSPTLTTGYKVGKHRIQGISDEFIPDIVRLGDLDAIVSVDDGDAILMARKLAAQLGLGVGISSGANFLGALKLQNKMGRDAVVVTVFPDDNKKYLSTDLMCAQPELPGFLSFTRRTQGLQRPSALPAGPVSVPCRSSGCGCTAGARRRWGRRSCAGSCYRASGRPETYSRSSIQRTSSVSIALMCSMPNL